ncbi:hypothetical protein AK830_g8602 [Neonectria ditissima]|uniref:Uncharacterized protein n=1 Tax=Neonectria ditissima TaxID=78410 RepID=A0A0P7AKA9_9HYPO|nr:hypothetical protein AK830_g8602 [Neonectria ditissima]
MTTQTNEIRLADLPGRPQGNPAEGAVSGDTISPIPAIQGNHLQFERAPGLLRVVIPHLFGHTTLHLVPVPPTMSRGEAMTEVRRLRDRNVSLVVRAVEGVYVRDIVEVVSIVNTQLPEAISDTETPETTIVGLGIECSELTQALREPHLFTFDADGPFLAQHEELLSTAMPPKALHVGAVLRKGALVVTIATVVIVALVVGILAGGPVVGFGCATAVGILAQLVSWGFA